MIRKKKFDRALPLSASALCVVVGLSSLGALVGCSGSTGGRMDPYETRDGENAGRQVSMPSLLEFCDDTAQKLVYDISSIPEVRDAPTQVVLELGDINNKTRSSTIDYEIIQRRLQSKIINSGLARQYFLVVENRQRMDREKNRITGEGDLLQDGNKGTARYSPDITYVLQGDFLQSERRGVSRYYFQLQLTHLASRQVIFRNDYIMGQEED